MYRLTAVASSPGPPTEASNPCALPNKHAELQDGSGGGESIPLDPSFNLRVSVCLSCLFIPLLPLDSKPQTPWAHHEQQVHCLLMQVSLLKLLKIILIFFFKIVGFHWGFFTGPYYWLTLSHHPPLKYFHPPHFPLYYHITSSLIFHLP